MAWSNRLLKREAYFLVLEVNLNKVFCIWCLVFNSISICNVGIYLR